jgi:hypothetical protein
VMLFLAHQQLLTKTAAVPANARCGAGARDWDGEDLQLHKHDGDLRGGG